MMTMEAHTSTKELDGLAAFALCEVDQAHGRNAPTVPAFSKLSGANQHVDCRLILIDCAKQRLRHKLFCMSYNALCFAIFDQRSGIANADHTKVIALVANAQANLTINLAKILHMQSGFICDGVSIEHNSQQIIEHISRIQMMIRHFLKAYKIAIEQFIASAINQTSIFIQHRLDSANGSCAIPDESINEKQDFFNISQVFILRGSDYSIAHKYHQRLLNFERSILFSISMVQLHLLIEGQETASQVKRLLLCINGFAQIVDAIILSISILIEEFVGIIHHNGFAILIQCFFVLLVIGFGAAKSLLEGCRILKGKSTILRQASAIIIPHITSQTSVRFIHKHQVILLKAVNRNSLLLTFLLELIHVDDNDSVLALSDKASILHEHFSRNGGQCQLIQMLLAHAFIGSQNNDLVDLNSLATALCALEIMLELQNVDMHDQCLTTACGAHVCQFIHALRLVGRDIQCAHELQILLLRESIQLIFKGFLISEILIKIDLSKQQRHVLKILQLDAASLSANVLYPATDILIILAKLIATHLTGMRCDFSIQIFKEESILILIETFKCTIVQIASQRRQLGMTKQIQKVMEQNQMI